MEHTSRISKARERSMAQFSSLPLKGLKKLTERFLLERFMTPDRALRLKQVLARRTCSITVVLENLHKDHNLSAILRTCEAFGIQTVHVVPQPGQGKVFRLVTRGCHQWLTVVRHRTVRNCYEALRQEGYRILVGALHPSAQPVGEADWTGRVALVFSNEQDGAGEDAMEGADGLFTVPLTGFSQSLNVSVAAGIVIHHVRGVKEAREGGLEPLQPEAAKTLLEGWTARAVRNSRAILGEMRRREKAR